MEMRHLRTFVTVIERGTLIAAARALDCSQATVTLHIQELEREFDAPLFDRVGKSVVITEAGRRAHARAVHLLDAVSEMKRDVQAAHVGDTGLVRLGSIEPTASVRIPPLLQRMAQARPGVEVRLETGGTGTICQRVASADLDIGIATMPPAELRLEFEPLFDEELVLVLPATARPSRPIRAQDVAGMTVLLTENGCAYRRRIDECFEIAGHRIQVRLEIGSVGAILGCVRAGMGVAIVPALAVPTSDPTLITRRIRDLPLGIRVGLVSRPQSGGASALVRAVRQHLVAGMAKRVRASS